jgi:hypothetical protein
MRSVLEKQIEALRLYVLTHPALKRAVVLYGSISLFNFAAIMVS